VFVCVPVHIFMFACVCIQICVYACMCAWITYVCVRNVRTYVRMYVYNVCIIVYVSI